MPRIGLFRLRDSISSARASAVHSAGFSRTHAHCLFFTFHQSASGKGCLQNSVYVWTYISCIGQHAVLCSTANEPRTLAPRFRCRHASYIFNEDQKCVACRDNNAMYIVYALLLSCFTPVLFISLLLYSSSSRWDFHTTSQNARPILLYHQCRVDSHRKQCVLSHVRFVCSTYLNSWVAYVILKWYVCSYNKSLYIEVIIGCDYHILYPVAHI